jgi:hypothetical protein
MLALDKILLAFSNFFLKIIVLLKESNFLSMTTDKAFFVAFLDAALCFVTFISNTNIQKKSFLFSYQKGLIVFTFFK